MQKNYRNDRGRGRGGDEKLTSRDEFARKSKCDGCTRCGCDKGNAAEAPFIIFEEEIIPGLGPIAGYRPVIRPN